MKWNNYVIRSVTIHEEVNNWIKEFRDKMRLLQDQPLGYATVLNLLLKLGILILTNPDKITEEQKSLIKKYVEEATNYNPPHTKFEWTDKYLRCIVPKILDGTIKEPYEMEK